MKALSPKTFISRLHIQQCTYTHNVGKSAINKKKVCKNEKQVEDWFLHTSFLLSKILGF